ncbi:MAG: hypothetical protein Q4A59_05975, partial [Erysipelotrichaceae bacterium]|nr:hypothetical protein [Erysipelotrichaceae bacterium]
VGAVAVNQSIVFNNSGVLKATLKNQELEVEEIAGIENRFYYIYPVDQQRVLLVGSGKGESLKPIFCLVNIE